jgi:hypothetical protein
VDPDRYDDFLQPLSDYRQSAVNTWLSSTLKDCPACEKPIRVMDSHRLTKDGLMHTGCAPADA